MIEYYDIYTKQLCIIHSRPGEKDIDFTFNIPTITTSPKLEKPKRFGEGVDL